VVPPRDFRATLRPVSLDAHRLGVRLYRAAGCCPMHTHCRAVDGEGRFIHVERVTTCVHVDRPLGRTDDGAEVSWGSTTGLCDAHAAEARVKDAKTRLITRMHSV